VSCTIKTGIGTKGLPSDIANVLSGKKLSTNVSSLGTSPHRTTGGLSAKDSHLPLDWEAVADPESLLGMGCIIRKSSPEAAKPITLGSKVNRSRTVKAQDRIEWISVSPWPLALPYRVTSLWSDLGCHPDCRTPLKRIATVRI
jgi:hypothetical protein